MRNATTHVERERWKSGPRPKLNHYVTIQVLDVRLSPRSALTEKLVCNIIILTTSVA